MTLEELQAAYDAQTQALTDATAETERLKGHNETLLGEKKAAKTQAQKALEDSEAARLEASRKSGDVEAIEKSWSEKFTARETELNERIKQSETMIDSLTTKSSAATMASELAVQGSASVLEPHILNRLRTEIRDGKPTTIVLDAAGQPSAMTLGELKAEISNNAAFAPLIVGSKANGAGGHGGQGASGAGKGNMGGSKSERLAAISAKYKLD